MGAHHFCDKRIKPANQFASRVIIMLERSFNQCACIKIIHVIGSVSTPLLMTGGEARVTTFSLFQRAKEKIVTEP